MNADSKSIEIEDIKDNINILDYAGRIGFTIERVGNWFTLKEHDSVRIDKSGRHFFRNSTGEKGSIIDFVMAFEGKDLPDAISYLKKELSHTSASSGKGANADKAKEKQRLEKEKIGEFKLPAKDDNMRNVFAYLIKKRRISQKVVSAFVKNKMLYQDKHKNCVFVSYDGKDKPIFACKRGTNTYKRFVGNVQGSDYSHSFFVDNGAGKLVISESVIDAMSIMTMVQMNKTEFPDPSSGEAYQKFDYLCLAGVGKFENALSYHLPQKNYDKIYICLDRDKAGFKAASEIMRYIEELENAGKVQNGVQIIYASPKFEKDFNEYLQKLRSEKRMPSIDDCITRTTDVLCEETSLSEKDNEDMVDFEMDDDFEMDFQ